MAEVPTSGPDEDSRALKHLLSQYDGPAYIRRARQVQGALDQLLDSCRRQRDDWLRMVRIHLGVVKALAGDWSRLRPLLAGEEEIEMLGRLYLELSPRLRIHIEPTTSLRTLRRALKELLQSLERFNRRWQAFLPTVDLTHVNELRDGYNRYYVLEKECAVRSVQIARQGFCRLEPLTTEELAAHLPLLPVPRPHHSIGTS